MGFPTNASATNEMFTFQDAVERIVIARGLQGTDREINAARMAVADALREIPGKHDWPYFRRVLQFITMAPEYDLNVSYDHTGGGVERQLTRSSGTWGSGAGEGQIVLLNNLFRVEKRISDTVLQLAMDSNPGTDTSSTSAIWVKNQFYLNQRVRRVLGFSEANTDIRIDYVNAPAVAEFLRINPHPSTPIMFTLRNTGRYYGGMDLEFAPPPLDARQYLLTVEMQPRPVQVYATEMEVSATGSTVTATDGTFTSRHVGSVIRLSSDSMVPTGTTGHGDLYNPFAEQKIITSITSSTVAVVDSAFESEYTGVRAIVTDPLDIDPPTMLNYFMALAIRKFMENSPVNENLGQFVSLEQQALMSAITSSGYVSTDLIGPSARTGMTDMSFILNFPITET